MIPAVFTILVCQLVGEIFARSTGLPIPGPVLGMGLMFLGLFASPRLRALVRPVADTILGNLMLLFVPAGVGALLQLETLGWHVLPLALAVVVSTLLAITTGALAFVWVARAIGAKDDE